MENEEFRTVRVYTKKYTSKDKDGNSVEKESKQKQVSLKKEDPFEDDDLVMVLSQEDYQKLIDNQFLVVDCVCLNYALHGYMSN